jgi:hypothetical protein
MEEHNMCGHISSLIFDLNSVHSPIKEIKTNTTFRIFKSSEILNNKEDKYC